MSIGMEVNIVVEICLRFVGASIFLSEYLKQPEGRQAISWLAIEETETCLFSFAIPLYS